MRMRTEEEAGGGGGGVADPIASDFKELKNAAMKLASDATKLGSLGLGTTFLQWVASIAAIYLLVLDRTNWKTNILTGLLVPYIFFSLPSLLFNIVRGQIGRWIAFVAVILRVFFPNHFREWVELPAAMILIIVVAPSLIADTLKSSFIGAIICLVIAAYLLQEHIRASGGFRNSFTRANGISNTVGIILLVVYPIWALIVYFVQCGNGVPFSLHSTCTQISLSTPASMQCIAMIDLSIKKDNLMDQTIHMLHHFHFYY